MGTSIAGTVLMGWLFASDEQAENWSTKSSQFGSALGIAAARVSHMLMGKVKGIPVDSSPADERLPRLEPELIKIDKEKGELLKQKADADKNAEVTKELEETKRNIVLYEKTNERDDGEVVG